MSNSAVVPAVITVDLASNTFVISVWVKEELKDALLLWLGQQVLCQEEGDLWLVHVLAGVSNFNHAQASNEPESSSALHY